MRPCCVRIYFLTLLRVAKSDSKWSSGRVQMPFVYVSFILLLIQEARAGVLGLTCKKD